MKLFVICLVIAMTYAAPQNVAHQTLSAGAPTRGRSIGSPAPAANPVRNWGPKAYGMGLNNRFALPVNTFLMERAIALANLQHGVLVRVDVDGDIELTDTFGREVEIYNRFGVDMAEIYGL